LDGEQIWWILIKLSILLVFFFKHGVNSAALVIMLVVWKF